MNEVVTIRPAELEFTPGFRASVHETPVNVYRMKVDAQSSDPRRFSFSWRAPGNNLLCSPQAYVEFDLCVHVPMAFTEEEALSANRGWVDRAYDTDQTQSTTAAAFDPARNIENFDLIRGAGHLAIDQPGFGGKGLGNPKVTTCAPVLDFFTDNQPRKVNAVDFPGAIGYRPVLAFGEGDAVGNCIESIQYTINGCSISHQNWHLFKRSLDRCWIPSQVMQKVYYQAGGAWNAYDVKCLSGASSVCQFPSPAYDRACNQAWAISRTNAAGGMTAAANAIDHRQTLQRKSYAQFYGYARAGEDDLVKQGNETVEGFTTDSGLQKRKKNFFNCITEATVEELPGATNNEKVTQVQALSGTSFIIRVRFPLAGAVFNPCWGESGLARSCPYQRLALAIPNLNQGSITILFKDLEKCLVRRLGRTLSLDQNAIFGQLINNSEKTGDAAFAQLGSGGGAGVAAHGVTSVPNASTSVASGLAKIYPFQVKLRSSQSALPSLHLTYLRMQSFRRYPQVASFSTWRTQTYLGPVMSKATLGDMCKTAIAQGLDKDVGSKEYLSCNPVGGLHSRIRNDIMAAATAAALPQNIINRADVQSPTKVWNVSFQNLQFAQPPSYILITAQKSSDMFTHKSPLEGNLNSDMSATRGAADADQNAIMHLSTADAALTTNQISSTKAAGRLLAQNQDSNLSIMRLDILVQSSVGSIKYSSDTFPYLRDQAILWNEHKRNCCEDYIKDATIGDWSKRCCCVLLNVSQYLHGLGSSAGVAFPIQISAEVAFANRCRFLDGSYAYDKKYSKGPIMFEDFIRARPVFVGLFDKQVVQIASSSAVLSAQNLSQASAAQILSSRQ